VGKVLIICAGARGAVAPSAWRPLPWLSLPGSLPVCLSVCLSVVQRIHSRPVRCETKSTLGQCQPGYTSVVVPNESIGAGRGGAGRGGAERSGEHIQNGKVRPLAKTRWFITLLTLTFPEPGESFPFCQIIPASLTVEISAGFLNVHLFVVVMQAHFFLQSRNQICDC
jgi:hypothetical protein